MTDELNRELTLLCNHPTHGQLVMEPWAYHFHRIGPGGIPTNTSTKFVDVSDVPRSDILALDVYDIQKKNLICPSTPADSLTRHLKQVYLNRN